MHLGYVPIITKSFRVPFTGTPNPSILIKGFFIGIITSLERILIELSSFTITLWLARIMEMTRAFS